MIPSRGRLSILLSSILPFNVGCGSFPIFVRSRLEVGEFPTTRLSALLGLREGEAPDRRRAWDALLGAYWKPAYKHVRVRSQKGRDDAEDLVQAFFARAFEKDFFKT